MIYGSVCSGIEAASVAWRPLGWQCAWVSEIEKFPSQVLAHRWPDVPNLGDMIKLHENKIFQESEIDLLVGGTPCQSFSVAGLRKGLDDPRGNLCLEFLRLVDIKRPRWFVWENVPGVLSSSGGRDFGSFLGAVAELGYGACWRICDAQYYGVPQRRRRVFVVGYLGDWRPAAAVLFERESLSGHIKASRKTRQNIAPTISARTKGGGGLGTDFDLDGGLVQTLGFSGELTADDNRIGPLDAGSRSGGGQPSMVLQTFDRQSTGEYGTDTVASTVSARDYKSASDLICFSAKDYGADASDKAPTLRAGGHTKSHANAGVMPAVCFRVHGEHSTAMTGNGKARVADPVEVTRSLDTCGGYATNQGGNIVMQRAVCVTGTKTHALKADGFDGSEDGAGRGQPITVSVSGDVTPKIGIEVNSCHRSGRLGAICTKSSVRRLTPRECERLQGFPDDYTLLPVKKAADGPRYKALGNSMAVPVMHWIGRRIQLFEDTLGEIFFG